MFLGDVKVSELESFTPLRGGVLVKRLDGNAVTKGGIIIPDTAQEKPQTGIVVSVGKGERDSNGNLIPNEVAVGDKVLFSKWGGTEIKLDGNDYLLMKQSDILGVDYSNSEILGCSGSCCGCKGCN